MAGRRQSKRPRRRRLRLLLFTILVAHALPVTVILVLRWLPPPTTAFILLRESGPVERRWVAARDISPHLAIAVVAAEDQLFPRHRGFDTDSLRQAIRDHRSGRRTRGASTISQQVAKNLFLWPGQSLVRKALEAWLTVQIELLWPKQRILEVYLNIAEFGPGIYGAEAASQRFFGKPAARLEPREAALLAAVLPNPARFRADAPSPYVLQRLEWIQRQVRQLGGPAWLAGCCPGLAEVGHGQESP
jgi:monofunctional biosynthetic peptidoglycan transglycosylase